MINLSIYHTMDSNMDLILDMMPDENVIFEQVKADETNEYY